MRDILLAARTASVAMAGVTRERFDEDVIFHSGVVHQLQIIGEAARLVSEDTRRLMPELPWAKIVGMRHRLVHNYFELDLEQVWTTASDDLGLLIGVVERALAKLSGGGKTP